MAKFKPSSFIIALISLLVATMPVHADIAPPEPAPGSGITPSQETNVKMVAENVLMVVKEFSSDTYNLEVTADFLMRNLGETEEQMQVRFPLENISGLGDMWGQPAEIRNFKANVDGYQKSTYVTEEPYQANDIPLNWAVFSVDFPPGHDVHVRVSYVTDVQNEAYSNIEYILGTGAGWFDSIGTATITLRFPYAVNVANILFFEQPDIIPENVVIIGKEIRWHWKDYEPDPNETVRVSVVNPAYWKEILSLEAKLGANPADINTAIALSKAYQKAGSEKHGCMNSSKIADLAEIAIEQSLPLSPKDIHLHLQLAEVYLWRINCFFPNNDPTMEKLQSELKTIFELDPTNERALEIQSTLQDSFARLITPAPSITTTPTIVAVTATTTKIVVESQNSQIPAPTISPELVTGSNDLGWKILWGTGLLIIGVILGATFRKQKQNSK